MKQKEEKWTITYISLIKFLSQHQSPLGDLCNDILDDDYPRSDKEMIKYLEDKWHEHGDHLHEPIVRLKMIYEMINFFSPKYHTTNGYEKIIR